MFVIRELKRELSTRAATDRFHAEKKENTGKALTGLVTMSTAKQRGRECSEGMLFEARAADGGGFESMQILELLVQLTVQEREIVLATARTLIAARELDKKDVL